MRLRDLSVSASSWANLPSSLSKKDFNVSCWHIQEIFLNFLSKDYVLDGAAKTNIKCGSSNGENIYRNLNDVSMFFAEDFDFEKFADSTEEEKDRLILNTITESLCSIAQENQANVQPILEAQKKVLESGFRLTVESKIGRSTKSRKIRVRFFREIKRGGDDWYVEICNKQGHVLDKLYVAQDLTSGEGLFLYKKSFWEGGSFVVCDRADRETFRINIKPFEESKNDI